MRQLYTILLPLLAWCLLQGLASSSAYGDDAGKGVDKNRVLRLFDFEERRLGNVEDQPMHWLKVEGPDLPHYVNGQLATDRARSGEHSFRLDLNGGSCIYRYEPGQIPVQSGAHYRVQGYCQTTPLPNARARITAYFTDVDHRPLTATVRHSPLWVSPAGNSDWHELAIELSADDPSAAFLVLEVELLQPNHFASSTLGKRALFDQDIHGSVWFDDIAVSQVPQVTLSTDHPGNVFRRSDPLKLSALVNDRFTDDLAAQLVLRDATDKLVYQRTGAMDMSAAEILGPGRKRMTLALPEVQPGWYRASMVMSSQGVFVGEQTLDFVRLADDAPAVTPDSRFGVIATNLPPAGWSELPQILPLLCAGRVKLAVWSDAGDVQQLDSAAFDRLLSRLQELNITPTACLMNLPPSLAEKLKGSSWLQILNAPREDWQPQLAYLISRHANHLDRWQLGADNSEQFVTQKDMRKVYSMVFREFANLVDKPDLAMPWPAWYELDGELPATVALSVPSSVLPQQIPLYMQDISSHDGHNLSLSLQPLDRQQYGREMQIQDLAQRVVYSLAGGASRIDLPLPFTVHYSDDPLEKEPQKEPQELLMVMRTLMTNLSGTTFRGKVPIADGVEAFLFDRNGQGVLVLWDRGNSGGVKPLAINLGERPVRVDLWGNVTPLVRGVADAPAAGRTRDTDAGEDTRVQLNVGPMPMFLVDIDGQLAQLRASVAFDQPLIESSFEPHARHIRFINPYRQAISGTMKLKAPPGWTMNPPTFSFSLNPGETFDREVTIEFPYNSFGGAKAVRAEFLLQAERNTTFSVPLPLTLGLSDVGTQTLALRDRKDVIVQQIITNYSDRPINYTAFAVYPGQARQERLVTNLAPGRTTIKKYRFNGVDFMKNTTVRAGVKELDGTRVLNEEVPIQ